MRRAMDCFLFNKKPLSLFCCSTKNCCSTKKHPTINSLKIKQKIVMKVAMHCQERKTKALKVASGTTGVYSVAIEGEAKDRLVVIGEEVDAGELTKCMRKKVGHAELVSVEEVKGK